jgi:WD40 repeat protein
MPADCRDHLQSVHFVPGGKYVIASMASRTDIEEGLFVLDATSGAPLAGIRGSELEDHSPDGRLLAFHAKAGEKDYYLEVRDWQAGEAVLKLTGGYHGCFSADGKIFACARDGNTIEFYDLETKQRLGPPRPHPARIWDMTFAPSGSILAAHYNDSTVILWDPRAPSR